MVPTSLLLIQSMEALLSTATSLLDLSSVSGRPRTSKAKPEETLLVPLLPSMVLEPLLTFLMLKTTKLKNWLWWKLEKKKSGSSLAQMFLSLLKPSFSVFHQRESMTTHPSGRFMNNTFALGSVWDTLDALLSISINFSWRSKVFMWCFTLLLIHLDYLSFTKCAHWPFWSRKLEVPPLMVKELSSIFQFRVMNKKPTWLLDPPKMSSTYLMS